MEHIYDMIVIGGGPAGYTAALYAAAAGLDTLVLEKMSAGGQMALTGDIDNYPGFDEGINGFALGLKMQKGAERFGAKTMLAKAEAVDFSGKIKKIETANGNLYCKTAVIAAGAVPKKLCLENEREFTGRGVHYCAHCDGRFYKDKTTVVVGGGNSAAADALYLSRLAKKVYVVHRRDTLRASAVYQKPLFEADNIEFIWNSTVEELITEKRVTGAKIKDCATGKLWELPCDGVFVSIGREPATDFLAGAVSLDEKGYIIADETTKTSVDGVFAAGDIRTKELRQVVTAAADGAVSAHFAEKYLSENG